MITILYYRRYFKEEEQLLKRTSIAILILGLITLFVAGCTKSDGSTENNTDLNIYTSIYPIQFAVEQIAGETADVHSVYPPGVDAHSYEPTSKDMTNIARSDAFIYLGAGMEGFAESAADALDSEDVKLIELGKNEHLFDKGTKNDASGHSHEEEAHSDKEKPHDGEAETHNDGHSDKEKSHDDEAEAHNDGHSDEEKSHDDEAEAHNDGYSDEEGAHDGHSHGDHDPHIWLDPMRMIELSEIVKDQLIELNPDEKDLYQANFNKLKEQLQSLDHDFQTVLEAKTNKHILVSHAAYGYWEERYGLEQIAINGLSTNNEPSQKELTEIIDQAEKYNLNYIIFEQNTSNRVSKVIQEHIQAKTATIHNLSVLTEKDLENNEDYLSIMKKNLETLDQVTS
ncbi:zinc ABC transporter substrate-binding protein [Virgibacillus pantothenticus]|nr:zinc ABC transporter substrate-binding protein [Virgibacillus pantothenticus]MBU8599157.1 zinc ABC transporter substrate-binding protein [Virgibacillus pantothenticus]MBU8633440.1 zinc ABC transporter substrate-binding protein [Virgibacillus pantothenticus]MBU8640899.1 zinc ABC transporter substrate-binding protein [Virgibacillus pantothenticus]MBU8645172.1 zinc ABC transporter substrate-binding protein [Virgibacillus pantothenticus]